MIAILRAEAGERLAEWFEAGLHKADEGDAWLHPDEVPVDLSELPDESLQPTIPGAAPFGLWDLDALSGLEEAVQAVPESRKVHAEALPADLLKGLEFCQISRPGATPLGLGKRDMRQVLMEGQHLGLEVHQEGVRFFGGGKV